jgi:DNA-binding transcriptional LysR family regulator
MDIRQLRYFIQVCKHGSISQAAKNSYISSQGLNMSILRLENELNCKLFQRMGNGVELTGAGQLLLPHAERIVREMDAITEAFHLHGRGGQVVNIGCAFGVTAELIGELTFLFQRENPDYAVMITELRDLECEPSVRRQEVDLGFGIGPVSEQDFESWLIYSSPYCLLVHEDHALAREEKVSLDLLRSVPIMIMDHWNRTYSLINDRCRERGFEFEAQYLAAEVSTIHRLVSAGQGIGVSVISAAAKLITPHVVAIPFDEPDLNWNVVLFHNRGNSLSAAAQALKQYVLENCVRFQSPDLRQCKPKSL